MATMFTGFSTYDKNHKTNKLVDMELIKRDLLNHFHTRKGERVMNPEFGSIIWDMLYEPLTSSSIDIIEEDVRRIINSDSRVEFESMHTQPESNGLSIFINLMYTPLNALGTLEVTFDRKTNEGSI